MYIVKENYMYNFVKCIWCLSIISYNEGEGWVRQKVIFDNQGEGGQPKSDFWWQRGERGDIINEQPLISPILHLLYVLFYNKAVL